MGHALVGYENKINERGQKYISLKEPSASIMKWVFSQVATGNYSIDGIGQKQGQWGLKWGGRIFGRLFEIRSIAVKY